MIIIHLSPIISLQPPEDNQWRALYYRQAIAMPLLVKLMFTNCVVLWLANFYLVDEPSNCFFQECEGSDIILDDEFSFSLEYSHL